jgi:hypothetical protein
VVVTGYKQKGYDRGLTLEQRFWDKVEVRSPAMCWPWINKLGPNGYGQFNIKGKCNPSHRIAYMLHYGSMPKMVVDHICMNRACNNPNHLRDVTRAVNNMENSRGVCAENAQKKNCRNGHPYDTKRTKKTKYGTVVARECSKCLNRYLLLRRYKKIDQSITIEDIVSGAYKRLHKRVWFGRKDELTRPRKHKIKN